MLYRVLLRMLSVPSLTQGRPAVSFLSSTALDCRTSVQTQLCFRQTPAEILKTPFRRQLQLRRLLHYPEADTRRRTNRLLVCNTLLAGGKWRVARGSLGHVVYLGVS
jgi:hypothetical protein